MGDYGELWGIMVEIWGIMLEIWGTKGESWGNVGIMGELFSGNYGELWWNYGE